jgi:sugar/nucleoside kinase (ribokinase family)
MVHRGPMHSTSLLVVGSVALDDLEGPFGKRPDVLGGSASFFSTAASLLAPGAVSLVAVVGDDFPAEHLAFLKSRVDLTGLERVPGKTFRWAGRYADDLATRTTLDTQLGVFADFRPRLSEGQRGAELVFLGNIDPVLQLDVMEQVKKPRYVACDTMNFWISGKLAELEKTLARVDLLIVNDEEARQLAGTINLSAAAARIQSLGPDSVIIKRGDAGALLYHEGLVFSAPALPIDKVVDPTGAGDTFAGGLMGYLARVGGTLDGRTLRRAVIAGSVAASFCVEDVGLDRLRTLTMADIEGRFRAFHALTQFDASPL